MEVARGNGNVHLSTSHTMIMMMMMMNAPYSHVADILTNVPKSVGAKGDFRHFPFSEQHVDGCVRLARYDFLLLFYNDSYILGGTAVELEAVKVSRTVNPKKKKKMMRRRRNATEYLSTEPFSLRDAAKIL